MKVSIVAPVYNEVENVQNLVEAVVNAMKGSEHEFEFIVVDDGSTDGTREELARLVTTEPHLKVVEFRRNYGQTAAMSAGMEYAAGDAVVFIDGDLQNEPQDIPAMLAKLDEGYDLVHGWRKDRKDAWLSRKLPSKIANQLIQYATGFACHDLGCSLKAMRREIADDLRLYGEMHRFIPILAYWHGARCAEMVTRHHPRLQGKSKYGIMRTFAVLLDLITVVYLTRYSLKPMRLFGGIGALSCLGGIGAGSLAVAMKLVAGYDLTGNPLLYTALFGVMVGLQFVLMGMTAEMNTRTHYESQNRRPYAVSQVLGTGIATNKNHKMAA